MHNPVHCGAMFVTVVPNMALLQCSTNLEEFDKGSA